MIDRALRAGLAPALDRGAERLERWSVTPGIVTAAGLALGLGSAAAAGWGRWWLALVLWLTSRLADGLDGPLARRRGATAAGGFADIVADFTVYGAFVVGVAVNRPEARLAAVVLLFTYYVSGASFLAWASLCGHATDDRTDDQAGHPAGDRVHDSAEDGLAYDDGRAVRFVGGLAEGFETIVAYVIVCLVPGRAELILWIFAAAVAVTAAQRVWFALRHLARHPPRSPS